MEQSIIPKEICPQMPQVENGVRIFGISRKMMLGAPVGVLIVPDEHRGDKYDWLRGPHRVVAEQTVKASA